MPSVTVAEFGEFKLAYKTDMQEMMGKMSILYEKLEEKDKEAAKSLVQQKWDIDNTPR